MPVPAATPYGPMDEVADWLRANGIEPTDVPIAGPIAIEDGRIEYTAMLRNEAGRHHVDPDTGEVARESRSTDLKVHPTKNMQVKGMSD